MKKEEKRFILILVVIGIIVIGIIWGINNSKNKPQNNITNTQQEENKLEEYVQKMEDGSKLNVSDELQKTKTLDGLEITNIQLKEIGGITTILADVNNKNTVQIEERKIKVDIVDKNGEIITTIKGKLDKIPAGESVQLNMAVTADVSNAYDFIISNF